MLKWQKCKLTCVTLLSDVACAACDMVTIESNGTN